MALRMLLRARWFILLTLAVLPMLACGQYHDTEVFIVVNNRVTNSIEPSMNGKSYGLLQPGAHRYKVKVSVPSYDSGMGPNNSDYVTVYVTARNTVTGKSARTITLQMLSGETRSVDFSSYDFTY
jgi:hypothetical protein